MPRRLGQWWVAEKLIMKSPQKLGGRTNNNGIQEVYDVIRETFSGEHRAIIECDIPKWMRNRLDKFNQGRQINTKEMLDKKVSPGGLHLFIDPIEQALLRLPVEVILIERSRSIKNKLASLLHEIGHANCFLKKCRCVEDAHFEERHFL